MNTTVPLHSTGDRRPEIPFASMCTWPVIGLLKRKLDGRLYDGVDLCFLGKTRLYRTGGTEEKSIDVGTLGYKVYWELGLRRIIDKAKQSNSR